MSNHAADNYKARKEAFVSNLSGGSITEINLVTLVAPAAILLWTALQRHNSFFTANGALAFVVDFLLNVCSILFAVTAYSSVPMFLSICLVTPAILLLLPLYPASKGSHGAAPRAKPKPGAKLVNNAQEEEPRLITRPFLTHYRGAMMVVTVVAILAVDFPIFPRRFAKVETWGTSLMDLGVGSFVFSAGVVSARALYKAGKSGAVPTVAARTFAATRHAIPLLVLGFIRLLSVKGLDYAEHVTEYGVHWNFFFTLALLPPFVEIADSFAGALSRNHTTSYCLLALTIATTYEIVLDNTSLLGYILISPRGPGLLAKNREGVFSFFGYLSIFLAGRGTGATLVVFRGSSRRTNVKHLDPYSPMIIERSHKLVSVLTLGVISTALYWLSTSVYVCNLNVSRRLANLPYVLWVVAFNQFQLVLFGLAETYGPNFTFDHEGQEDLRNAMSTIMQCFNQNGLVIFLAANLLTGLVNLSVNTLEASNIGAMAILITYAGLVTAVAVGLDYFHIKIKM